MMNFDGICCTITDRFDAELFNNRKCRVRILANFGAGLDHVDLAAARDNGIVVTNTPDALTDATAEIAIMLMLMAARRAGEGERELRAGAWTGWRPTHLIGMGLAGKTLGLLGFGRIAQATAARAVALGMAILYHSRRPNDAVAAACYVDSLDALAAAVDVLSVHVPGGPETHHLINAQVLERMKPSAVLVNTARGSVVDEGALALALSRRRIAAAGLDVFEHEPHVHPALLACENIVLLPHLGSATIEARTAMGMQAARNLEQFFAGREPPNRVA
jgi:lactate dehydrogenase-like 2-hydroxyacid dehydrogenase